jgi:hypothetical protein
MGIGKEIKKGWFNVKLIGKEIFTSVLKWEIYELERQDYSGDRPVCKICGDSDNLYYLKKDGIITKDSFYLCQGCLDGVGIMQSKLYE